MSNYDHQTDVLRSIIEMECVASIREIMSDQSEKDVIWDMYRFSTYLRMAMPKAVDTLASMGINIALLGVSDIDTDDVIHTADDVRQRLEIKLDQLLSEEDNDQNQENNQEDTEEGSEEGNNEEGNQEEGNEEEGSEESDPQE